MISTAIPNFFHNRGQSFSKRFNSAGVYYFNHQYRPAPCLIIGPFPGRMAERARLQPLACMNLTQGSSVWRSPSRPGQPLVRRHILNTIVLVQLFPSYHAHTNGMLKLEDPWLDPHKLVVVRESICPTDGSTLSLGSKVRTRT